MHVIQRPHKAGERVIALGMFDGVHRGHRALLMNAKRLADELGVPLRVCTFNRHPLEIIRPENPPEMISTIPERASLMYGIGVDEMDLIPFDKMTADMEPEVFLERMRSCLDVRAVVAGWNYSFGRGGKGGAELLYADGKKHGYDVLIVPPVKTEDGEIISSTTIRNLLQQGCISKASAMMGHPYELHGPVTDGKHMGHRIGVPTANVDPGAQKQLPAFGVYPCRMITEAGECPAAVNIGIQPTIPSGKVTVEAHALTESPELYGQKVRLSLLKMLREEKQFRSREELAEQIERDRNEAMRLFDMA